MMYKFKKIFAALLVAIVFIFPLLLVNKEAQAKTVSSIVEVEGEYLLYENGVFQKNYTGLKRIKGIDSFDLYYLKKGKAICGKWKTIKDKNGRFRYYFGKNGKAYKADSVSSFRTTKVCIKKVKGKKYGFDENGHRVRGIWSTGSRIVYLDKKTGIYDKKASMMYQREVKVGKESSDMLENIKKVFGNNGKVSVTNSCNPFDLDEGTSITGEMLKKYQGYTITYKNIVISLTKNEETGIYHMDGASPIDI